MAKYYVALDLGSDSMAACYDVEGEPKMVRLQDFARATVPRPQYLYETDEAGRRAISPRLRSQVGLRNNQPSPVLPPEHARLDFFCHEARGVSLADYGRSLFELFHEEGAPPDVNAVLPNPKVMFQYGIDDAFPSALTQGDPPERMALTPEVVLEHLTVQVLRNLVFRWGPLREVYESEPHEIEVVITIPNVYSVEHGETLRRFVMEHSGVGAVSVLSESDALAYYFRSQLPARVEDRSESTTANPALPASLAAPEPQMWMLTIDIGRGTTDMSLIQIDSVGGKESVVVQARTGRSSGGGELTYLFAQFYERQIRLAFREAHLFARARWELVPTIVRGASPDFPATPPVSFLWLKEARYRNDPDYLGGLDALFQLVEEVKREYGGLHQFRTPESAKRHVDRLADAIVGLVLKEHVHKEGWAERHGEDLDDLREVLRRRLVVDKMVPAVRADFRKEFARAKEQHGVGLRSFLSWLKAALRRKPVDLTPEPKTPAGPALEDGQASENENLINLASEIDRYIRENVDDLLIELAATVVHREEVEGGEPAFDPRRIDAAIGTLVENDNTYVVVGGQASHFAPLRGHLEKLFVRGRRARYLAHFKHFQGAEAKNACCMGAVVFRRAGDALRNPDDLHGSYALVSIARGSGDDVVLVPTEELNRNGRCQVETRRETGRYLIYSPGMIRDEVDDAKVSRLKVVPARSGYEIRYERDASDGVRRLSVDGEPIRLQTYGGLKSVIWQKVWPEQLPSESPRP
jgi:hypothetical protein